MISILPRELSNHFRTEILEPVYEMLASTIGNDQKRSGRDERISKQSAKSS